MMADPTRTRRRGRAGVIIACLIAALAAGAVGGYWLTKRFAGPAGQPAPEAAGNGGEVWYTCGMHPQVLQREPGICPICNMKLTPRKDDDSGDSTAQSQERRVLYWRSSMDPNYVSDKPGQDAMGMDLVPVYADADESTSSHTIRIDPVTIQNMGLRTATIGRGPLIKTIRTVGRVDYDEQRVAFVNTKFNGWIETLYANETGQVVTKGDPLFDVYSPELYSAQNEYLSAIKSLPGLSESTFAPAREEAIKMVEAAATKLRFMDLSEAQVEQIRQGGQIVKTLTIESPTGGIVTEKMALEGMYVESGMRLYTIADLSRVWVYVDVYEYQLPWVRIGQSASITLPYIPGREFTGTVVYIYPYLEKQTRVIQVRMEFENSSLDLKPGMYTNVSLESELQRDALLIPREAYIDSGTRQVTFVDLGNGKFAPRDIQVGVEADDGSVEVLFGLDEGEVVVTSGQFMLDAESKLKEAVAKMMEPQRATTTKRSPESGESEKPSHPAHSEIPADAAYACPMDEHPDETDPARQGAYFSAAPGECPWCGMALKPMQELPWVRLRQAAKGGDVAYTCPDHQHVFADTSGPCPRCGKDLTAFSVMYTCPDPQHAGVISTFAGNCPRCQRGLAGFRGMWLDPSMAAANVPAHPGVAEAAAYRCQLHPLVHSNSAGNCTICSAPLQSAVAAASPQTRQIPAEAKFTCPMQECWQFSAEAGECSVCGMKLKPIEQVEWAKAMLAATSSSAAGPQFLCPMHPEKVRLPEAGICPICGMQLVPEHAFNPPQGAPEKVAAQMDYIMEHYLELQRLLAADRSQDVARQALALASASEELVKHLDDPQVDLPPEVKTAGQRLHRASLKTSGESLAADRVTFVELSAAVRALTEKVRPDRKRWPKLYIYHCPMSKGDWLQSTEEKANPYYGFKMLTCGELKAIE